MKSLMVVQRTVILGLLIILPGCTLTSGAGEPERMLVLGSALTKLSAAAESAARYKHPPENISDAEFLVFATKHDPALLKPFSDYAVRVLLDDRHAVVLVCDRDRTRALLEDAGCSAELDRHPWGSRPARPCEFTLKAADVCAEKQTK